jgi:hypothetical protein
LNKTSKKRFLRKYKDYSAKFAKGKWTQEEYVLHTRPLFAFAQFADSLEFRAKMINSTIKRIYAQAALTASIAVAVGTTMLPNAVLPIATTIRRPIATTIWASAPPSTQSVLPVSASRQYE